MAKKTTIGIYRDDLVRLKKIEIEIEEKIKKSKEEITQPELMKIIISFIEQNKDNFLEFVKKVLK